ncbi:hypothetical protein PGTUg99_035445 [Puccinia graminis f. sp. tritici]|uniref:Retrotransposon gag domain-containing protein n=1 Tax=Puccinia graminis f. sp. tritici TaxID=56615 RepID=A0A5B0PM72_PUCGR|nr:hypothetical protein PGTUg99_035445 [Puccinia graminis f. sp. tritici]
MKTHIAKEFLQIRNNFDTSTSSTNTRLFQLESRDLVTPATKAHFEPPHYSHLSFSGEVSETHQFCYSIRDTFARIPHYFSDEREKILWISSYFRTTTGRLGDQCPSYSWWQSLLTRNASKQDLPTKSASALAPFVLPELTHSDTFLSTIEDHFSSHTEEEDARKAFFALRQGTSSIADFNIQFNTLLYSVDLSPRSAVKHYERAINQKIIELGIQRGGWSELTDLDDMQRMAVKLSLDVGRVNQINQRKFTVPPPRVEYKTSVTSQPAAKSSQSGPMDIDAVLAAVGFNWRLWRETCVARELCFRCVQPFDREHIKNRGCPRPENTWVEKEQALPYWKEWGGVTREKHFVDKGKKRDSVDDSEDSHSPKRRFQSTSTPVASGSGAEPVHLDSVSTEPMSIGEIMFNRQMSQLEYEEFSFKP